MSFNKSTTSFVADAVLFDMDGTLTDSIAAVEAAWGKVAKDIGQDPAYVIAATHGKRAIDNLAQFKPELKAHEMDDAVTEFENTILYYADAFHSNPSSTSSSTPSLTPFGASPSYTPGSITPLSDMSSEDSCATLKRPSFIARLSSAILNMKPKAPLYGDEESLVQSSFAQSVQDTLHAWQVEAASVDRSVRILPGVKKMMDSIPQGRYAVATSGAKTYAYGCMTRVGITPPAVTITADDKRLKAGKPAPDPFLLAADCLGFDPKKCVVFEDSPSGIRAGVASGATVIALCTSHERSQIENCGAHFLVENMEDVVCEVVEQDGSMCLKFTVNC
ncbi:HAD-like protein [Artomyces pyxidatus]|uniref:HAD-like protein n=1 Tax=Artomyces pyxidatus TaxID=48021 RepID=A0ACB8TKF7_9AGAM|nr:HAD-like protein [Artomyces pyxidatus]